MKDCCTEGLYEKAVPVGHPDFSRLFLCECPAGQAVRRRRAERTLGKSMMPPDQREMTFSNFYPDNGVKLAWPDPQDKSPWAERVRTRMRVLQQAKGGMAGNLRRAKRNSLGFAQEPQNFLTLLGEPGCGKTHLAAAIANECLAQGLIICFAVVPDLLDSLRATFSRNKRGQSYESLFQAYLAVDLLILDDVGVENDTDWAGEKLYQLVNHRYNYRLPLVVTTNEIPHYLDPRLQSRLFDARNSKFEMLAGDYRLMRKAA